MSDYRCKHCGLVCNAMIAGPCPSRRSTAASHEWNEVSGAVWAVWGGWVSGPYRKTRAEAESDLAERDQLRARIEDYQRAVERRDEMLAASDHREAELRAEVERLRGVFRYLATKPSGSDCPYCTPLNNWGHTVLCPLMRESSGEEGLDRK
jgi:hypothetical protein